MSGWKVRALLLTSAGTAICLDVQYTCNVSYTVCYTFAYVLGLGQRSSVRASGLGTGYVYEAIARAHAYVHRLYNMQDKAGH